ncbi:MAG: SRPBCC domain-containing protein [bacterium]|nr:SRPBCC domain-containing protein [bacterium]
MTTSALPLPAAAARLELEVSIAAPRDRVWQLVIDRPNDWWISELRCVGPDSTVAFEPGPRAGAALVEHNANGSSLLWFTILALEPQRSLNLAGAIAPPFGGPCQAFLYLELADQGDGTVVRLTNSLHGHITESALQEMQGGWQMLLERGLKARAETDAA